MATSTLQEITLHLPAELVERIQETASQNHQSLDKVIEEVLNNHLVSPVEKQVNDLFLKLALLPLEELEKRADSGLSANKKERLSELLAMNRTRQLTTEESDEIDCLLDEEVDHASESVIAKWLLQQYKLRSRK